MVAAADRVEWIQVANEVEAILLEYALIKRAPAPLQHPAGRRQELPVAGGDPARRPGPGRPWSGAGAGPGSATSVPTPTWAPSATPSTCCCARFPIRSCSDTKLERHIKLGKPCLMYHIERCSRPVHRRRRPRATTTAMVEDLMASSPAPPTRSSAGSTREMRARPPPPSTSSARPAGATSWPRCAWPCERQQVVTERPEDLDVVGHRRRPARGGRVRLPRPPGPDRGPAGLHRGQGGGPDAGPSWWGGSSSSSTATPSPRRPRPPAQAARVRGGDSSGWTSGAGDPASWGTDGAADPGVPRQVLVPELPEEPDGLRGLPGRPARAGRWRCGCPQRGGKRDPAWRR